MRFGGLIFQKWNTPEEWTRAAKEMGYSAVYFPVDHTAPLSVIDSYVKAAKEADLVICEIGIWNNLLDPDKVKREQAFSRAVHQLELAEYTGANCCVNTAGTYNPNMWDGPHPDNFTKRAFDDIVSCTQRLIDTVKPQRTFYTLEPMPWMYPDTPECCLDLIRAVDRKAFAAHLDIVNVINSPAQYYRNSEVIREWFRALGPHIKSIHAKDTVLREDVLTVHLDECRPGTGFLDYRTYLECASKLDENICVMLEHMTEEEDYILAAKYIKGVAAELGISL